MAVETNASAAVDPVLTGLWYSLSQEPNDYVGDRAAPLMEIDGVTAQILQAAELDQLNEDQTDSQYGGSNVWTNYRHPVSKADPPKPVGVSFTTGTVTLDRYAYSAPLYDVDRVHMQAAHGFDLEMPLLRRLFHIVRGVHERAVGDFLITNANFGSTTDPGDYNTVTTDLIDPIYTALRTIKQATGVNANKIAMNMQVAHNLVLNDDVRQNLALGSDNQQVPMAALSTFFRSFFGLDLIVFANSFEGSGGTQSFYMDDDDIAIYYASEREGDPSFVNTWVNRQLGTGLALGPNLAGVKSVRDEVTSSTQFISDAWYNVRQGIANAGYALTDVLA